MGGSAPYPPSPSSTLPVEREGGEGGGGRPDGTRWSPWKAPPGGGRVKLQATDCSLEQAKGCEANPNEENLATASLHHIGYTHLLSWHLSSRNALKH